MEITVEYGEEYRVGERYMSVKCGEYTLMSDLVYDNNENPGEKNIMRLFSERLRKLLEDD